MNEKEYTPKNILSLIAFGAILVLGIGMITGCNEPTRQERFEDSVNNYGGAPVGATNIELIDDRWYTFEWRDQCFLAMKGWRQASVTKIDCEEQA